MRFDITCQMQLALASIVTDYNMLSLNEIWQERFSK